MTKTEIKTIVNAVLKRTNKFEDIFSKTDSILITQRNIKPTLDFVKSDKKSSLINPTEIFSNFKPKSYKVELVTIFEMIKNGSYKSDQELLERLIEENTLLPSVFFENRKKYTPCGVFYHKYGRLDVRILNQILLFEYKENALNKSEIQIVKSNEYTFAFYRQIFQNKYWLLVKTTNMNSRNHFEYQKKIETYYSKLLGSKKITTMNLNAAIPFSYDVELFHNKQSLPFVK